MITEIDESAVQTITNNNNASNSANACSGCSDQITGSSKIRLPCEHIFCDKCVDSIIIQNGDNLKCSICEVCVIELGNCCKKCLCENPCCEGYKSCSSFCGVFFCYDLDIAVYLVIFAILTIFFTMSSILMGIIMLSLHSNKYDSAVNSFILASIIFNTIYCIIFARLIYIKDDITDDSERGASLFFMFLIISHVLFALFGFCCIYYNFKYDSTLIVFVVANCLNALLLSPTPCMIIS